MTTPNPNPVEGIGEYLCVQEAVYPETEKRKTKVWSLLGQRDVVLGVVVWHTAWRCYVLSAHAGTILNAECMRDIARWLDIVRPERRT